MLHKVYFYGSIATVYILTIGAIGALLYSPHLFRQPVWAIDQTHVVHQKPIKLSPKVITGKPVRITIPSNGIDLLIDEGIYDPATRAWTLSPNHAQFAVMTIPPNNHGGTTFIYGHGTDAVFGKIGTNPPPAGTAAQIYTANGHMFSYTLQTVRNLKPNDTSILKDTSDGSPELIVQTCTGELSQWRTMFTFSFSGVI
jgi:hypothetical protein